MNLQQPLTQIVIGAVLGLAAIFVIGMYLDQASEWLVVTIVFLMLVTAMAINGKRTTEAE